MSPELETLDQLIGGELSLAIVRTLYSSDERFLQGTTGLLSSGDVVLVTAEGIRVPDWQIRELLNAAPSSRECFKLRLTDQGARRMS